MMKGAEYSHIKAIFFDMDGLLVDTELISYKNLKEILATAGVELTKDWYIRESLGKGRSARELAREAGIAEKDIEPLWERRHTQYSELLENEVAAIDGVSEVLQQVHSNFLLAVVTSSYRSNFDIVMRKTGLLHFFDFSITGDDIQNFKPHPEPYLKAVERSQKKKEQCLVLEDSGNGTQAAKEAGLTCFAIPDALTKTHDFSRADEVLSSIREVPPLLGI